MGFLIGCTSNPESENNEVIEKMKPIVKKWVLSEESVMNYDSLISNYEFLGEWRMDIKMGTMNETLYYEYYNSNDENLYYLVTKENSMTIYEKKRDGNKYWGLNKDEWVVFDENGDRISYDREGLMSKEDLKSYGITYTKIR